MGYGGKTVERQRARELRARAWTLLEIAEELGVSKSSVSIWTRDVEFVPKPRNRGHREHAPHPLHLKKLAELERCRVDADVAIGEVSERDMLMFCLALYAGEGSKSDGALKFANSDERLVRIFLTWLRSEFEIDERRLRVNLYLHADLDLDAAIRHWEHVTKIPRAQFTKPYRAVADLTRRRNRHVHGCATVCYSCRTIHRRVMAMIEAISSPKSFRDSSAGRASDC